jgi:hypothetical protein
MKLIPIFCLVAMLAFLVFPASAVSYETASRAVTAKGEYGILVPLGLEQVIPLNTALMYYNWIAVMLLFFIMSMASQRNTRFFAIITPLLAALFAYFGWLNSTNAAQVWGLIGLTALVGVAIYMKDTNKEKWGSGGPGSPLLNIVFFMILIQSAVGVVNTTGIWQENTAVTPSQYQNVDLAAQMGGMSNTGGLLDGAIATAVQLLEMSIMILKMVISIIITVAAFSVTLLLIFPWMTGNVFILAVLGAVQVVIWLLYSWFFFQIIYKPMPEGGYI